MEVDFPRQESLVTRKRPGRSLSLEDGKTAKTKVQSVHSTHGTHQQFGDLHGIWKRYMTPKLLTEGVLGLGVVKEIRETKILLECADGVAVDVSVRNFGSMLLETLRSSSVALGDIFQLGQMLAFRVIERKDSQVPLKKMRKTGRPVVSIDPFVVNLHVNPGSLTNGLVLNGSVESVEDKGIIVNLGLQSVEMKGFLLEKNLPSTFQRENMMKGQLLLLRIDHDNILNKEMRVISLSGFPEMECLNHSTVEKLTLNSLMPGSLLSVTPIKSDANGVYVEIGNGLKGYVSRQHLPPRYRSDPSKCLKTFRTVVMFCQQNSSLLVLNGLPDIVAVSKFSKRTNFEGINIGDIIECKVCAVDRRGNVYFDVICNENGKNSLRAFAKKNNLEVNVDYKVGSIHRARVLSQKIAERQLIVTTQKNILTQKMISVKDAVPGDKVTARIETILANGLLVKIYNSIPGFIHKSHLSDKLITRINKHFAIGGDLECRILFVDTLRSRLILTHKPSLITNRDTIIKSYTEVTPGMISTGFISYQHPSGGLIVSFYGGVRGFMFPKEVERLGINIKIGLAIRVRVISVKPQEKRMLVGMVDLGGVGNGTARALPFQLSDDDPVSFSAVIENVVAAGSKEKPKEILNIVLRLGKKLGGNMNVSMSRELLTDCLELPFTSLIQSIAPGSVMPKVTILGDVAGNLKVTSKRFLIDWLEKHPRITKIEQLVKGQLVCGTIIQKHPQMGYFVELGGGSALTAPARFIRSEEGQISQQLQLGQTVIAAVSSVNLERKRFSLILDIKFCVPTDAESDCFAPLLAQCALEELNWFAASNVNGFEVPKIGECINVRVENDLKNGFVDVRWVNGSNLKGFAQTASNGTVQKGDYVKALVLNIRLPSCDLDVLLLNDGFQHLSEEKLKSVVLKESKEFDVRIWWHGKEYIIGTAEAEKSIFVVCVSTRKHPNLVHDGLDHINNHCTVIPQLVAGSVVIGTVREKVKQRKFSQGILEASANLILTKKIKQFGIYRGKVMGMWRRASGSFQNAVELQLPDGSLGRLHACEFDEIFLEGTSQPVQSFLKQWEGKKVTVKVISFTKLREKLEKLDFTRPRGKGIQKGKKMTVVTRLAECTMRRMKLSETKKKQSLLGYPQTYMQGSMLSVFVCEGPHVGVVKVEVSPLWNGVIRKQNLHDENLMLNPTDKSSALIDIDFEPGEKLVAQVVGVNVSKKRRGKTRHRKCLELTLNEAKKVLKEGDRVTGRVVKITQSPSFVVLELTNNQRAVLTLTAITPDYHKALEAMKSFQLNQIYHVQLLRFNGDMGQWLAVTETRYSESSEGIKKESVFEVGSVHHAFITSVTDDAQIFAEVNPGIIGRVDKCNLLLRPDDLIKVCVNHIFPNGGLKLSLVELLEKGPTSEKQRKRFLSNGSDTTADLPRKKSRSVRYSAVDSKFKTETLPLEVKLPELGFDWSLKGFTPTEFAKIGQIGEKTDVANNASTGKDEYLADQIEEEKKLKTNKQKTKEELKMEEERELVKREQKIREIDWVPDNATDFDRLVVSTPNSSILWIKYISFFLGKNDIEKARAVAERALSVISFREEEDIFNVWTAYLNLEANFGTEESLKAVFGSAIKNTDALKMYKQMVKIYQSVGKIQETDDLLEDMLKRFRHDDLDVWFIYGQHLMETKRADEAIHLMKKAISCLPQKYHVIVLNRFAQLEFKYGDVEQSKTIFESILNSYPKRTDVWTVYIDLIIKSGKVEEARQLLKRVTALKLSTHKIRLFFKKWMDLEQKYGTEKQQDAVKERAVKYIETVTNIITES